MYNMLPPIKRDGGKHYMIKHLLKYIPSHIIYVEVFGGAGHLLFAKRPSEIEVFNDLDSNVYIFYKVVRERMAELVDKINWSPFSRDEYDFDKAHLYDENVDEVEKARRFFMVTKMEGVAGFNTSIRANSETKYVVAYLRNAVERFEMIRERLKYVSIEHKDFREIIRLYDSKDTFFYLDPPYIINTRLSRSKMYKHEMSNEDHKDLVNMLLRVKGKCLLSGYDNEIYRTLEHNGWHTSSFTVRESRNNLNNGSNVHKYVTEKIWYNYEVSLFDDVSLFDNE